MINGICSSIIGYIVMRFATHPTSKTQRKLPNIKIKNLQILPNIRITVKGRVVQLHHWFNFTLLLGISILVPQSFLNSTVTQGFLLGGIIQGLTYPDRKILKTATERTDTAEVLK